MIRILLKITNEHFYIKIHQNVIKYARILYIATEFCNLPKKSEDLIIKKYYWKDQ